MKSTPLTAALAAVLAVGTAAPVLAQPYDPAAQEQYRQQQEQYRDSQMGYYGNQADYESRQREYQRQQAAYQQQRDDYERARAAYDARYGYGAYVRRYGAFETRFPAPSAGDYGRDVSYRDGSRDDYYSRYRDNDCERRASNNQVAGGLIGALAGAAIGSNVAARGVRTEGAILGGVVGAVAGSAIGKSTASCDAGGYYYSYNQTYAYRESAYDRRSRSGRYDYNWYARKRCRLAIAPTRYGNGDEYRYVRVCPDGRGRYRITG